MKNDDALTWGNLLESANLHANELGCEMRLEDESRADSPVQCGAAPVRILLVQEGVDDSSRLDQCGAVLVTQAGVMDGLAVLRIEDCETGCVSLVSASGANLLRMLYI